MVCLELECTALLLATANNFPSLTVRVATFNGHKAINWDCSATCDDL
jgi:hypothetical protein